MKFRKLYIFEMQFLQDFLATKKFFEEELFYMVFIDD